MVTHKLQVDNKIYHITPMMIASIHCIPSDQSIQLVVEKDDGTYLCEETVVGPIQSAIIDFTKKQLNTYAIKLCRMLEPPEEIE